MTKADRGGVSSAKTPQLNDSPQKWCIFIIIDKKNLIAHGSDLETENNVAIISMSFHDYLSRHSECRTIG